MEWVNLSNAIDISFNTGPREVSKIELILKKVMMYCM
jgi:hypothetical protein